MYTELKKFIEQNIDLIENSDWPTLFHKCISEHGVGVYFSDFLSVLKKAGIDNILIDDADFINTLQEALHTYGFYKVSTIQPNNTGYLRAAKALNLDVYSIVGDEKLKFIFDILPNHESFIITYKDYPLSDLIYDIKYTFAIPDYTDISKKNFRKIGFM